MAFISEGHAFTYASARDSRVDAENRMSSVVCTARFISGVYLYSPKQAHLEKKTMSISAESSRVEERPAVVGHQEWLSSRGTEKLLKCL
jgi:hypothetical protein